MIINMLNEMRQKRFDQWGLLHYFVFTFITLLGFGGGTCAFVGAMLTGPGITSWSFVLISFICTIVGLPCFFFVNSGKW